MKLELLKKLIQQDLEIDDLTDKSRKKEYIWARSIFCAVARKSPHISLVKIGTYTGRDHATVISAIRKCDSYLKKFPHLKYLYDRLMEQFALAESDYLPSDATTEMLRARITQLYQRIEANIQIKEDYNLIQNELREIKMELTKKDDLEKQLELAKIKLRAANDTITNQNVISSSGSHQELITLIHEVPPYHAKKVYERLKPIVAMLEKPSMHNNVPVE